VAISSVAIFNVALFDVVLFGMRSDHRLDEFNAKGFGSPTRLRT
jgi:hypothetical protein